MTRRELFDTAAGFACFTSCLLLVGHFEWVTGSTDRELNWQLVVALAVVMLSSFIYCMQLPEKGEGE